MKTKEEVISGTSNEIQLFLTLRLQSLRREVGGVLNINPFLMAALRDFHQIKDQRSLAEFMLIWHLGTGHSTSFGKRIDEGLLPSVFGTVRLNSSIRHKHPYNEAPFDDIDHVVKRHDGDYLLSLKSSSYSIQYAQAMAMYKNFHELGVQNLFNHEGIVVGVIYGHKGLLTDKYRILKGSNRRRQAILQPLDYVEVKSGAEFWSWLNDDEVDTQDWVLEGILHGAEEFKRNNPDSNVVVGGAAQQLVTELKAKYSLPADGSIDWFVLLHAINDDKGEDIGTEAVDVGSETEQLELFGDV